MSSAFDQAADLVAKMTSGEKAQLLELVAGQLGNDPAGIESRADVCGGEACVVRTRIPVWLLEQARRLGASDADILKGYPALRAADLVNAWAYVQRHSEEIDAQIHANEEA